ncbi:THUMP domain-containing class I SAM-dependent RNA methyltransferase [Roseateles terrae]|uniref:N6-adenine-specific DNA methylase n=1 Tax=Roseateles terrae TaxID=431060 RepID=A0ABR6GVE7_9BURK|nr:THUMP domain-containing protein [Roseateles terrae]MBB3196085.1 putative N6-adenine-specific DNA methylase [Roseateles terrae]OWQ85446.1 RNA methyltransferase [Roseateles terrae]
MSTPSFHLFLPCPAGVESWLEAEVREILSADECLEGPKAFRGGVGLLGTLEAVMRLNLHSRLAQRVLVEVAIGEYYQEDDIYSLANTIDWSEWITPRQTLRVDTTAQHSPLHSLNFATLRVKDAVCDVMREVTGERPSVDTRWPDLPLQLHLTEQHATLYVDSSGEPLFKRGWREDKGDAPLKETLAAAMLAAAGWKGTPEAGGALHDPCCGSGTIVVEAATIACGIAPGIQRRFAFEKLKPFQALMPAWRAMKDEARAAEHAPAVPLFASDVAFRMVDFARRNAQRAGVEAYIQFNGGDALERPAPKLPDDLPGTLMLNPPYGERIEVRGKAGNRSNFEGGLSEERDAGDDFFPRLSAHWKRAYTQHPAGWTAWLLCPEMKLPSKMRLKESRRVPMWNGPIECRLFKFDLIAGSARKPSVESDGSR